MRTGIDQKSPVGELSDDPERLHPGARRLGLLLLAVHLGLVLWTAFLPVSAAWMADTNLTPFATVQIELAAGTGHAYLELLRSVLLLAPLGVLLPLAGGDRSATTLSSFVRTLLGGMLIAIALEGLQSTLTSHLLNVDDVLLAGVGIALAHLAVVPAARAALRRRDRSREAGALLPSGFGIASSVH